jgi:hypothetical protein
MAIELGLDERHLAGSPARLSQLGKRALGANRLFMALGPWILDVMPFHGER